MTRIVILGSGFAALTALRKLSLRVALETSGASLDLLDPAYEAFFAARNQVQFYPDALEALARIAARVPVAALSKIIIFKPRLWLISEWCCMPRR